MIVDICRSLGCRFVSLEESKSGRQFTIILREVQCLWDDSIRQIEPRNFRTVFMPQSHRATERGRQRDKERGRQGERQKRRRGERFPTFLVPWSPYPLVPWSPCLC